MKKGVVLSVNKFSITLLTPDGEFVEVGDFKEIMKLVKKLVLSANRKFIENLSLLYFSGKKSAVISAVVMYHAFFY